MPCCCRTIPEPEGLGDTPNDHLPGGAAEALHGDARRGWRPLGLHLCAACPVGGPALHQVGMLTSAAFMKNCVQHWFVLYNSCNARCLRRLAGLDAILSSAVQTTCVSFQCMTPLHLVCREIQTEAYEMIKGWTLEEHQHLRDSVPSTGLKTPFRDGTLQDVAKQVIHSSAYMVNAVQARR